MDKETSWKHYTELKNRESSLKQLIVSGGLNFAASLFGVTQGLDLFLKTEDGMGKFFIISGITIFVLTLAFLYSYFVRRSENDYLNELHSESKKGAVSYEQKNNPIKITETIIFLFLLTEGLILFSQIEAYLYSNPYLIIFWIIFYLFSSYKICFDTLSLDTFIPKDEKIF